MNNLPEKIYATPNFDRRWQTKAIDDESVEYTRTDAFIEKVRDWLVDNIYGYVEESQKYSDGYSIDLSSLVSDFRKAMKRE